MDKVLISGTTAFVTTNGEEVLSRSAIRKAFDPKGLKVSGVKKASIAKPKEAYQLAITGGT
ncbi:hypothetical protein N9A94_05270 [Akkermansiaceae bacterium]|nr:hypothetical protein [Akkermansiaceae bacterium]